MTSTRATAYVDEMTSLRHLASVVRLFVVERATRTELEQALGTWESAVARVAKPPRARRQNSGTDVGGLGGSLLTDLQPTSESSVNRSTPESSQATAERSEASTAPESGPRTTWLTGYCTAYERAYGEAPTSLAIKRMARPFKALEVRAPRAECERRFGLYCEATPIRFYSVERFADTWPAWSGAPAASDWRRDRTLQRPGENLDQYEHRLAAL